MIAIPEETLHDQAGMERAFQLYFERLYADCAGTMNALLKPRVAECCFEKRSLTIAVTIETWMVNPNGRLHGGVTATVADMVMGLVSRYFSGGKLTPTIHMDVTYLSPAALGEELCCRAECVKAGFTIDSATARLWVPGREETPVATATATYYVNRRSGGK